MFDLRFQQNQPFHCTWAIKHRMYANDPTKRKKYLTDGVNFLILKSKFLIRGKQDGV